MAATYDQWGNPLDANGNPLNQPNTGTSTFFSSTGAPPDTATLGSNTTVTPLPDGTPWQAPGQYGYATDPTTGGVQFDASGTPVGASAAGSTGSSVGGSGSGPGDLVFRPGSPFMGTPFVPPTDVTMQNDPGYQFRMAQALRGVQSSAFAKGLGLTGGTLKDISDYIGNQASNEYGNVFNRALQTNQTNNNFGLATNQNAFNQGLQTTQQNFNMPYSLAQLGLTGSSVGSA